MFDRLLTALDVDLNDLKRNAKQTKEVNEEL